MHGHREITGTHQYPSSYTLSIITIMQRDLYFYQKEKKLNLKKIGGKGFVEQQHTWRVWNLIQLLFICGHDGWACDRRKMWRWVSRRVMSCWGRKKDNISKLPLLLFLRSFTMISHNTNPCTANDGFLHYYGP